MAALAASASLSSCESCKGEKRREYDTEEKRRVWGRKEGQRRAGKGSKIVG
jgi:hypothetical protein